MPLPEIGELVLEEGEGIAAKVCHANCIPRS
jgi:hypothetical protein